MSEPMTGYTRCPKCGLVVYVHKDEGTCFVCGKIKIERGKKKEDLMYWGTLYEDLVLPFAGVIIVVGLLAAAIIHWRFK